MNIFLRTSLLAIGLWLGLGSGALADSCDQGQIETTMLQAKDARQALSRLPVNDEWPTALSPEGQAVLAAMKARLGDLLDAYMHCASQDIDPAKVERDLAQGMEVPEPASGTPAHYGDSLLFGVERPVNQPALIAVTAALGIPCGTDTVLFLFAPEGGRWKELLRWQSQPYPEINGAFASFGYEISPSDEAGRWFLVTKTVAPWCSSTWSMIRYAVLRPQPDRLMPKILYSDEDSIWWGWGDGDFGRLTVAKDAFDLRFHAESIDPGILDRLWIRHFTVNGDLVRRAPPIAISPRDFVDEWIVSSWILASRWSKAERRPALQPWHAKLQALREFEYGGILHCDGQPDRYQVALTPEDEPGPLYVQITGQTADYQMIGVGTKPDPSCSGADLLESMATQ